MRVGHRPGLIVSVVLTTAVTATVSMAENAATGQDRWPGPLEQVRQHAWPVLGAGLVVSLAIVLWSLLRPDTPAGSVQDPPPPTPPQVPDWVIDRTQVDQVVAALRRERRSATVGITAATALHGAGGFGKTTVAELVWADRRIQRRFKGRIYRIVLGRDVRSRAEVAAKVCETARFVTGDATVFEDPDLAGAHLARLLRVRPPMLLIVDDVWWPEQIRPFMAEESQCVRLVTTRLPSLLPPGAERVLVDEMSPRQAEILLTRDIEPSWPPDVVHGLLDATGRWPLLLRLVNRLAVRRIATGADSAVVATEIVEQLRRGGPGAVDDPALPVELDDPRQRSKAVRATIEAAALLLPPGGYERFTELGVFAEDEYVPLALVAGLWRSTANLSESESRDLCTELAGISLLHLDSDGGGRLRLHDVIREFLRARLDAETLRRLNATLVRTAAQSLPAAEPRVGDGRGPSHEWWRLPDSYLADHLTAHLSEAGDVAQALAVATDLRWIEWRLDREGVAGVVSDFDHIDDPAARRQSEYLTATAHLLGRTDPEHARASVLRARLGEYAPWRAQAAAWLSPHPTLRPRWPLPDVDRPSTDLRAVQSPAAFRDRMVRRLAVSADATLVAAVHGPDHVCMWDPADGQVVGIHTTGGSESVRALAFSGHRLLIATVEGIDRVRVRDTQTGRLVQLLMGAEGGLVRDIAFSPDLSHLAVVHGRGTVHVWELASGRVVHSLSPGPGTGVDKVALSAGGTTLATADSAGTVRLRHLGGDHAERLLTDGGGRGIQALACPGREGRVATSAFDGSLGLWDAATGEALGTASVSSRVQAAAFTPDATTLFYVDSRRGFGLLSVGTSPARTDDGVDDGDEESEDDEETGVDFIAVSEDGTELITRQRFRDHLHRSIDTGRVRRRSWTSTIGLIDVSSPDGVADAGLDGAGNVRLEPVDYARLPWAGLHNPLRTCKPEWLLALSRGGSTLAVVDELDMVQIWDLRGRTTLRSLNARNVTSGVFSPDGKQLATAGRHGTVRVWDLRTGLVIRYLQTDPDRGEVNGVDFSAEGGWIATVQSQGTVRVWNIHGELVTEMRTNGFLATCRWFNQDRALAVGGSRGVYGFDFDPATGRNGG